ncbi:YIP1 family protein [Cellulosilyticum ruminicola]|uniref:YIP1 family protein n=1 Tax=Cellulosilyticum ruminicola TaxID=425254 RepID=UPI0006CFCBA5|nr:YIP1 family protein [Cellulosilyticum ruminicola]
MDGGFAVVDRERLIAEETKVITPWYKNLINLFIAPTKAMEETIEADPVKGTGLGIFWASFFSVIFTVLTFINPLQKQALFDTLRQVGTAEDKLEQSYQLQLISGSIMVVITVILGAFISALGLQIMRAICKDKGSFKKLFIIALFSCIVSSGLNCIDTALQLAIGTKISVLGIGAVLGASAANPMLQTLAATLSIPTIWSLVILIVGYKVMTRKSAVKATIVVLILEAISVGFTYSMMMLSQTAMSMVQ